MRRSNAPLQPRDWETTVAIKHAHEKTMVLDHKHRGAAIPAFTSLNRRNVKKRPITLAGQIKETNNG